MKIHIDLTAAPETWPITELDDDAYNGLISRRWDGFDLNELAHTADPIEWYIIADYHGPTGKDGYKCQKFFHLATTEGGEIGQVADQLIELYDCFETKWSKFIDTSGDITDLMIQLTEYDKNNRALLK